MRIAECLTFTKKLFHTTNPWFCFETFRPCNRRRLADRKDFGARPLSCVSFKGCLYREMRNQVVVLLFLGPCWVQCPMFNLQCLDPPPLFCFRLSTSHQSSTYQYYMVSHVQRASVVVDYRNYFLILTNFFPWSPHFYGTRSPRRLRAQYNFSALRIPTVDRSFRDGSKEFQGQQYGEIRTYGHHMDTIWTPYGHLRSTSRIFQHVLATWHQTPSSSISQKTCTKVTLKSLTRPSLSERKREIFFHQPWDQMISKCLLWSLNPLWDHFNQDWKKGKTLNLWREPQRSPYSMIHFPSSQKCHLLWDFRSLCSKNV